MLILAIFQAVIVLALLLPSGLLTPLFLSKSYLSSQQWLFHSPSLLELVHEWPVFGIPDPGVWTAMLIYPVGGLSGHACPALGWPPLAPAVAFIRVSRWGLCREDGHTGERANLGAGPGDSTHRGGGSLAVLGVQIWVPQCSLHEEWPGAGPDTGSRRGFLPPPGVGLGPWPIPGNQHWALLPAVPGLSHSLPGDSHAPPPPPPAWLVGTGPSSPMTGMRGQPGSPSPEMGQGRGEGAGPDRLTLLGFQPGPCPW